MLAIDIGNTSTKFCKFTEEEAVWIDKIATAEISGERVNDLLSQIDLEGETVFIASVVGSVNNVISDILNEAGIEDITFIRSTDPIIGHRLETIETTGVDRLLTALSAKVMCQDEAVIVIQAGSAITVDFVSKDGVFEGGMIMPGPEMWLGSLATAAMLPAISAEELTWEKNGAGKTTKAAMLNGASAGLVGAVKEAVRRLVMSSKDVPQIMITGGWAEALAEFFPAKCQSDLVLTGIYLFANTR